MVPTPYGLIEIDCKKEGGNIIGTIKVPDKLIGSAPDMVNGNTEINSGSSSFVLKEPEE